MKSNLPCPRAREGSQTTVRTVRNALPSLAHLFLNDGARIHFPGLIVSVNGLFVRKRPVNCRFLWFFHERNMANYLLNGIEMQQRPCFKMLSLMPTTQVAYAPPCYTDGALPPFMPSSFSQSDESASWRYFTHTTRLCSFSRQPWFLIIRFVTFFPFFSSFSAISPLLSCYFSVLLRSWIRYFSINQPFT